jgi:hypothetical protein
MARLLVSVRSIEEARAALDGGAQLIDVKEPSRGPLGAADPLVWRAVRRVVPSEIPVSIALGELVDLDTSSCPSVASLQGIRYAKVGLAGSVDGDWTRHWHDLMTGWTGPDWVAVIYADYQAARAPLPRDVIHEAVLAPRCAGVLIDTWDKSRPLRLDQEQWLPRLKSLQGMNRFLALAGSLDEAGFARLSLYHPDWFAVRGAACAEGNRTGPIDPNRVALLAQAAARAPVPPAR